MVVSGFTVKTGDERWKTVVQGRRGIISTRALFMGWRCSCTQFVEWLVVRSAAEDMFYRIFSRVFQSDAFVLRLYAG